MILFTKDYNGKMNNCWYGPFSEMEKKRKDLIKKNPEDVKHIFMINPEKYDSFVTLEKKVKKVGRKK